MGGGTEAPSCTKGIATGQRIAYRGAFACAIILSQGSGVTWYVAGRPGS